jgi:hypothetical protein
MREPHWYYAFSVKHVRTNGHFTHMMECSCGTTVPETRRTCPSCDRVIHPDALDPAVQDPTRSTTTIAHLRGENAALTVAAATAESQRLAAEAEAERLTDALRDVTREHELVVNEIRELKARLLEAEERSRILRVRLDSLGLSAYRPFEASQGRLFPLATDHQSDQDAQP